MLLMQINVMGSDTGGRLMVYVAVKASIRRRPRQRNGRVGRIDLLLVEIHPLQANERQQLSKQGLAEKALTCSCDSAKADLGASQRL